MYYIDNRYRDIQKDELFDTIEDAVAAAEKMASKDYEDYYHYVVELKSIVKADRVPHPTLTAMVTSDNIKGLLGMDKDHEDDSEVTCAAPLL